MATLLRSLRFVRRLNVAGAAHRLGAPALHRTDVLISTNVSPRCLNAVHGDRNYVTEAAETTRKEEQQPRGDPEVDLMLNELDYSVRRYGTIVASEIEKVVEAVSRKGRMSPTQALLLIRCCGEFLAGENLKTRKTMINTVWETINALDVPLDVSHYNALLLVNLVNEIDFSPLNILQEMKEKNIEPNRVTFQRLIEQYCNKGDIAGSTKILEHMSKQEVPINESIFNSLIKGHSEAGDVTNAVKVLDIMRQAGIEPSANSYTAVLCVHAKRGDIEAIRSTFNECQKKDIVLLDKDILEIIYSLAINGHENHIDEMMTHLTKGRLYNKDAKPYILKLVEKGQVGIAYKLLKSMIQLTQRSPDYQTNSGHFFIQKLVVSDLNTDVIIKYCKLMKEENLNLNPFEVAVYAAYKKNMHHIALPLLKAWEESGEEIREHYFYPIFVSFSKDNNFQGILNTMKTMIFDFKITPTILTVKDYIVPYMVDDPLNNLKTLHNNNLPFSIAANAILVHLLQERKTKKAAKLILTTKLIYNRRLLIRNLVDNFVATNDVQSLCEIVHHQYVLMSNDKESENSDENLEDHQNLNAEQFSSMILRRILDSLPHREDNNKIIESILESYLEKGIRIEIETAERVRRYLQQPTPEIDELLNKLNSESLEPKPLYFDNKKFQRNSWNLTDLEEKADSSSEFKMLLAQQNAKLRNKEIVEKLIEEMQQENVQFNVSFCIAMIDHYSKGNDTSAADKWYKTLNEIDPNNKVTKSILLSYATALVNDNRIKDAFKVLEHPIIDENSDRSFLSEKLLVAVTQKCPEYLDEIFDILHKKGYFLKVESQLLGHLIRIHIESGNLDKAVEKFKWSWEQFKLTPLKNDLMRKLIDNEDAKALQLVTDIATQARGEHVALFDLSVAFLECNRPRQARKVLEAPGLRLRQDRVMFYAEKFYEKNRSEVLEKYIELLTGLFINLDPLYTLLLKVYDKEGKWEKCTSLWTQMQEDNIQPSSEFMNEFRNILVNYNQEIPFGETPIQDENVQKLEEALNSGDIEEAEEIYKTIPASARSVYDLKLIEAYMAKDDIEKACKKLNTLLNKNLTITPAYKNILTNILMKLVANNDFETIFKIVPKIRYTQSRLLNRSIPITMILNEIILEAGKYKELIKQLEQKLESPEKVNIFASVLHTVTIIRAMRADPELEEQVKEFALKAVKVDAFVPINTYWIYLFVEGRPEADKILEEYMSNSPTFHYASLVATCKDNNAWDKIPRVAELLANNKQLRFSDKRKNYTLLFTYLLRSDEPTKYDIAFECLRHALKVLPIKSINPKIISEIEKNVSNGKTIESLIAETDREKESATG